ncbi:Protein LURP-one-related 11 [Morus notabilis]|uniref:Protein LURP-one-related 11 n=1 Tax=Morus notabilis TaxID=981085 RepID=W9QPQ3_9ROSA|nr:protein LURP-one-related 11 [Morus notabilis]EXB37382.1 Protein LURP-one-related 11 [Morus notabilis]
MAKVHPLISTSNTIDSQAFSSASCSNNYITSKRETFTVWMKSLVMQGNGCTAYNENGEIVYRVDNYDQKNSNEVYLMDLKGKVLFTILRKKIGVFRRWEGYKSNGLDSNNDKPFFQVRKSCSVNLGKDFSCKVTLRSNDMNNFEALSCYKLEGSPGKSALRIIDNQGRLVAEAKRKQSSSGVILGDDVLTLVIEQNVDHSLVMALMTVYGLMQHKM